MLEIGTLELATGLPGAARLAISSHVETPVPDFVLGDAGRITQILLTRFIFVLLIAPSSLKHSPPNVQRILRLRRRRAGANCEHV